MDISSAIVAKSDQLNASDLTGSPRLVVILEVKQGNPEQPVNIITDVFGEKRPFKPSKTVLRILAEAWGLETATWVGQRMELFRDPKVRWAGEEVGGIRVRAITNITKPQTSVLLESKGKYAKHTVLPIVERDWDAELALVGTDLDAVVALGRAARTANAPEQVIGRILARHTQLKEEGDK